MLIWPILVGQAINNMNEMRWGLVRELTDKLGKKILWIQTPTHKTTYANYPIQEPSQSHGGAYIRQSQPSL